MIVPTTLRRIHEAFLMDINDEAMASSMMSVFQYMDSLGMTPTETASPEEWQEYVDRVENWTRTFLWIKVGYGFVGPSPPNMTIFESMQPEYQEMLQTLPMDEAIESLILLDPDARPWTVFQTETASRAPLPPTEQALGWYDDHKDLLAEYPVGAPWLLPRDIQIGEGDYYGPAYDAQLSLGLRERRAPIDYLRELAFARAAPSYFDARKNFELQISASKSQGERNLYRTHWKAVRDSYFAMHPIFAAELRNPDAALRRAEVLRQIRFALGDHRFANRAEYDQLRGLLKSWDSLQLEMARMEGNYGRVARARRKEARELFAMWAEEYTMQYPAVKPFYLRILQPEIGLDEIDLEDLEGRMQVLSEASA
jgi:hypothetical protein